MSDALSPLPLAEQAGWVVAVEGHSAWIETKRTSACDQCDASVGCGTSTLSKTFGIKQPRIRISNTFDARIGERIVVGLPQGRVVGAALIAYLLPILGLIAVAVGLTTLGYSEAVAGLAGFVTLIIGLLFAGKFAGERSPAFTPVFLRRESPVVSFTPIGEFHS